MDCIAHSNHSPLWRDILKGREILKKGTVINIGNENSTSLWFHHWIGDAPLYTLENVIFPESKAHWFVNKNYSKWELVYKRHPTPSPS